MSLSNPSLHTDFITDAVCGEVGEKAHLSQKHSTQSQLLSIFSAVIQNIIRRIEVHE